jgi:methyltransferase (TIGR00027 family)
VQELEQPLYQRYLEIKRVEAFRTAFMKSNTASRTAQYMALFRAVETARPKSKRLFTDPYAINFLDKKLQRVTKIAALPIIGYFIPRLIHKKGIGAISSGIARTKYIDDLLEATIKEGSKQVIILGAGFDTRSVRLDFLKNISIIEIDHPDTSSFKLQILKRNIGKLPPNVSFQQVDFNKQSLNEIAEQAKINFLLPTTIIWEGVTNYLTKETIDNTFNFTKQFISPLNIIFTYIDKDVLDNPGHFKGTEQLFGNLRNNEEQWTFGFNPNKLTSYLQQFDLALKEDLNATEYRNRYMPERKGILEGYEFYRVVAAKR